MFAGSGFSGSTSARSLRRLDCGGSREIAAFPRPVWSPSAWSTRWPICLVISIATYWQSYMSNHALPNLTWVPAIVIFFPLVLPGPPRRMLAAAIAAGAMAPLALFLLDHWGKVESRTGRLRRARSSARPSRSSSPTWARGSSTGSGARWPRRASWGATAWRSGSARAAWARCGGRGTGCWRAPRRSSSSGPRSPGTAAPESRRTAVRRFEREAQAIASLRSPHTVELFDFGVADDGAFYYVMELLDGLDADTLVRRFGPLPPERAIYLLRQVCHSLSEARVLRPRPSRHQAREHLPLPLRRGLRLREGARLRAREGARRSRGHERRRITRENVDPRHAGVHRARAGDGRPMLDGRADIYATGCVAYWLLTGQLVFTADTPMGLVMHHARTPAPPVVSHASSASPTRSTGWCMSCLAKDPDERPQTAKELSRAASGDRSRGGVDRRSGPGVVGPARRGERRLERGRSRANVA